MGLAEDANLAAVESVAKNLQWVQHPGPSPVSISRIGIFAPPASNSGVAILARPKTMVHIPLREDIAAFSSRVQITQVGAGPTTFRVTIGGTNVDYVAGSGETEVQILEGIRDAINTFGAPVSTAVIATARDTQGNNPTVVNEILIKNLDVSNVAEHTTIVSIVAGTGLIEADEDLSTLTVMILGKMAGSNAPVAWVKARNGTFSGIARRGIFERIDSAGFDRLYVELIAVSAPSGGSTISKVIVSIATGIQ